MAAAPAPGRLELTRVFVNTRDIDAGTDELVTQGDLARWLIDHELIPNAEADVTAQDLTDVLDVREAIRALLLANNDGESAPMASTAVLSRTARKARFSLVFDPSGSSLRPEAPGAIGAVGTLLSIIADAMADGTWSRLKACRNDTCEWAFYDHARNHSRRWCDMAVCGNRMKARTYRARHVTT